MTITSIIEKIILHEKTKGILKKKGSNLISIPHIFLVLTPPKKTVI